MLFFKFEGKRKDTSLVITRSFQYFFEHCHQNMLDFNYKVELQNYSEKYNSNNIINDIYNIEKLEKNDEYLKAYLIILMIINMI